MERGPEPDTGSQAIAAPAGQEAEPGGPDGASPTGTIAPPAGWPSAERDLAGSGPGTGGGASAKPDVRSRALRDIGDVAAELGVQQHVLRYWEDKFPALRPRRIGGGHRRYSPKDIALLKGIKRLLQERHLTIDGAQKALREEGIDAIRYPPAAPIDAKLRKRFLKVRDKLRAARSELGGS